MIRYGFSRRQAEPILAIFLEWVVSEGGGPSYNAYRIEKAWKEVSGTQEHTVRTFFKDGILYVTLDSSVLRSHLSHLTDSLQGALNAALDRDERFLKGYSFSRKVDKIVLK
ncbi:MAG: DUF721 domain-containing protein [Bacteroidales bacterium]|nr:DUF721 domain-containing protein [Bacteroidales bacterium]